MKLLSVPAKDRSLPYISIVVPAYNEASTLPACIEALKHQDYQGETEIILVDNNSTDETPNIAKKYKCRVIVEKRKGSRFAYQRGMNEAKGDPILVTNADTIVPPNWASEIVRAYRENPSLVGVGTKVTLYDASWWVNLIINLSFYVNLTPPFWGASMSCTQKAFHQVGGIDHGYNTNEDGIFSLLLKQHGKITILKHITVPMSGRRFNGTITEILKNWWNGIGLNAFYIQFHYFFYGKIKSLYVDFEDIRK